MAKTKPKQLFDERAQCEYCNYIQVLGKCEYESAKHYLQRLYSHDCERCNSIKKHSPEVFEWVAGILERKEKELEEKLSDKVCK